MKVVFDLVEALRSANVSEEKALKVGQSLDESLKEIFVEKLVADAKFQRVDEKFEAMLTLLGEKIDSKIASAVNRLVGYGVAIAGLVVAILKLWPN
jgi:hypothetical protein